MHLLGIALRSFSNSPAASDADRLLVYLLYYSFSKNDTAKKYSVASSLSPASRSVIFRAIVSLLNDTDEIVDYELDDLDELRLRSLRDAFQPIETTTFFAIAHSPTKLSLGASYLRILEQSLVDTLCAPFAKTLTFFECSSEVAACASVDFLVCLSVPVAFDPKFRIPFPVLVGKEIAVTVDAIECPSILLEKPDQLDCQHLHLQYSGLEHQSSNPFPALAGSAPVFGEFGEVSLKSLRRDPTIFYAPVSISNPKLTGAIQCHGWASSKNRQCRNLTLHPSGKCHLHQF